MSDKEEPLTAEQNLVLQFEAVSEALGHMVEKCEDARQFAAVARLAIYKGENQMAAGILSALIARLDTMLKEYTDVQDEELVDIVTEKMK